jgi:large subunit ribosomal protein L3
LTVGHLSGIKAVDVTAMTKGCGFQGVMKRWNFGGLRASHGTKKVHRSLGGTGGMGTNRGGGRPKKGKKMPGQYGNERVTTRNIKVVRVDEENGLLLVHGAVPGPPGGMVVIKETNKF